MTARQQEVRFRTFRVILPLRIRLVFLNLFDEQCEE
jgi:hypothetical protein